MFLYGINRTYQEEDIQCGLCTYVRQNVYALWMYLCIFYQSYMYLPWDGECEYMIPSLSQDSSEKNSLWCAREMLVFSASLDFAI